MKDGKIIYLDGKVLVNDYSKNVENFVELKEYDYQDNLIEILGQENIVEKLENEKKELNNEINNNYKGIKANKSSQKSLIPMSIAMIMFCSLLGFISPSISLFGIKQAWLSMGIVGFISSAVINGLTFISLKQSLKFLKRWKNGYELQLAELEKELEKNKEVLNQLRNNKTKENEKEAMAKKTDDIHNIHLEKYRKIRRSLMVYREIGENENQLLEYYNKDILNEKLNACYEPDEIEKIKTYFKNKK